MLRIQFSCEKGSIMRNISLMVNCALVVASLLYPEAPALAARQDFDVVNQTPWVIYHIYVRPSGGNYNWTDDALGSDAVLSPGNTFTVEFDHPIGCIHDVQIVWRNNVSATWDDVNLCSATSFRVWYDFNGQKYKASW